MLYVKLISNVWNSIVLLEKFKSNALTPVIIISFNWQVTKIFPSPSKPIDHLGDDFDDEILDFVKKIKLSFEKESHNLELLTLDKGNSLSVPELQSIPWEKIKNQ